MISYSITWTNGSAVTTYFIIDRATGTISAQNLDREVVAFFTLRITARDMGTTAMEGYAYLNVTILVCEGQCYCTTLSTLSAYTILLRLILHKYSCNKAAISLPAGCQ